MKSDHIEGHTSFALVHMMPYTLRPILSASSCICISRSDGMILSGHNFVRWIESAPPSRSHLCTKLGVTCWISRHCCRWALDKTELWKLYLATLGGYILLYCLHALPNPSLVACCLAFPSSSPPEPCLHISSITSPPTVAESIWHYRTFPKAARSWMSPKILQPPFPSAGVHLEAVSNGSVPR